MALQWFVSGLVTILLYRGCHAQQPACGRPVINSRINGGENAAPGRWPWFAEIKYEGNSVCGGSLINNQWVLTAAHCTVLNYISGAVVYLGVYNQSGIQPREVTRRVEAILCHPEFTFRTLDNDICLLKLSAPVNFTDYIQPVCLASANSTFYDGVPAWITGFGYNYYYYYYYQTEILQEASVPIVGNNRCNCSWNNYYYNYHITENMMCAGFDNGQNQTTWGDSGIPLVTKKDSVWVQTGIQSYLSFYSYPARFSIFTQVSRYEKWIRDRVSGMEPGFVTFTSPGNNSDLNFTCPTPTTPPTTTPPAYPYSTPYYPYTNPYYTYTNPYPNTTSSNNTNRDNSVFSGGANLIHFTNFISLFALVPFFHVFVFSG